MKSVASFRLDEGAIQQIDALASAYSVSRTSIVEDSVKSASALVAAGTRNHNALLVALAHRYGEDATISLRVVVDDNPSPDGFRERAIVEIDGRERDELRGHLVIEADEGKVHVFVELRDEWHLEARGVARIGYSTLLTHPIIAFAWLPWPPNDPLHGLVSRVGDLVARAALGDVGARATGPDARGKVIS